MRWPSASKSSRPPDVAHDDLPVEHVASGREHELREVASERLAVARLQEHLLAVHERQAAKPVELDLIAVVLALRQLLARERQLRLDRAAEPAGRLTPPLLLAGRTLLRRRSAARARLGCTRGGSPFCLRKWGGHGASPRPSRSSRAASSSRPSRRPGLLVDGRRGVAALAQARGDRLQAQLGRLDVGDLVPLQRTGHARVGDRPDRVGGGDGAVAGVLVVVDEHALALLLPPAAGRPAGHPPLDLPRQRERRAAHFFEALDRLDAHVHVDPARAGCLGKAAQARAPRAPRARRAPPRAPRRTGHRGWGRGRRAARPDGRGRSGARATGSSRSRRG